MWNWGVSSEDQTKLCFSCLRSAGRFVSIAAALLCSASIAVSVTPASARSHHGAGRHARSYHAGHHARHYAHHHHRHDQRAPSRWDRGVAQMQANGLADANATFVDHNSTLTPTGGVAGPVSFGSSNVVAEARRYLGGNPTGRGSLWCARFMNMVLQQSGYRGTGSDMANSFASYGQRVSGPQVGAIAVMSARPPRRPCRHHHRHRWIGKSDHDLGQQRQPRPRSADLARPDLCLRDADGLSGRRCSP